jgi:histidinol phosphatase-like PHP family hydrolase
VNPYIFPMMNFHIHSTWSDGLYAPEIIVREAINKKMEKIAITDHYETKKVSSVPKKYLDMYVEDLKALRKKYRDNIDIYIGIEVDFSPRTNIDELPNFEDFDLVLFEYVQDSLWDGYPLWMLLDLRKDIDAAIVLAHNDLSKNFGDADVDALLRVLESDKIGIELNTSMKYTKLGTYYYRLAEDIFSAIKNYKIPISVGSDMHENLERLDDVDDALSFIQEMHLEENFKLFLKEVSKNEG